MGYVVPLAAIGPIAYIIGQSIVGRRRFRFQLSHADHVGGHQCRHHVRTQPGPSLCRRLRHRYAGAQLRRPAEHAGGVQAGRLFDDGVMAGRGLRASFLCWRGSASSPSTVATSSGSACPS
ncbi:MAG: hypothetical protein WDN06_11245 [Asticcacaulis sp.]